MRRRTRYTKLSMLKWTKEEKLEGVYNYSSTADMFTHKSILERPERQNYLRRAAPNVQKSKHSSLTSSAGYQLYPTLSGKTFLMWEI